MWAVFEFQGLVFHHAHNFSRDLKEQLDRQNCIRWRSLFNMYQWQSLTQTSFQDNRDASADIRIKGEVQGERAERLGEKKKQQENKGENTGRIGLPAPTWYV